MTAVSRSVRDNFSLSNPSFFFSPPPAGRKITAGFTYLQRISKAASYDVWFPTELTAALLERKRLGKTIGPEQFPAQWAAVRQFELLQESGNHKIYDLDPSNLWRAARDLSASMRAGGYRILVATLGCYSETSRGDELELLDYHLQERIARMIHMLYLEEQSDQATAATAEKLKQNKWNFADEFPHVGMVLGAQDLFTPQHSDPRGRKKGGETDKGRSAGTGLRKLQHAKEFFKILSTLPSDHIVHDTAIGLQLPELNGEHQWNYVASPEETLGAFNQVLGNLFGNKTFHLRGYGDRMNANSESFYRSASLALS